MKTSIFIFTFLLFVACGSTSSNKTEEKSEIKSSIVECLRTGLSDYYEAEDKIFELLENEGLLINTKDSFAQLCLKMFSENIGHFEITEEDRKELNFLDNFGPHAQIADCSNSAKSDSTLTNFQVEFYNWFSESAQSGSMNTETLSEIITKMTDEEFHSADVRETTLFFCGQEIIRNHFFY